MPSDTSQFRIGDVGAGATAVQGKDITIGFTAEQVRVLIEAERTSLKADRKAERKAADEKIAEAGRQLGLTQGAMRAMLASVGQAGVSDEKLAEKLAEVFEHNRKAAEAIAALRPDNPVAQAHVADAAEAQTRGDREETRRHLRAAREAAEAAAAEAKQLAQQAETAASRQMLQAARATSAEAEVALAELDYPEAARLFGEAASLVPSGEPTEKGTLLRRQADALQCHGEERGDNTALRQAIKVYGRALELLPSEWVPLGWAMTQTNLGNALSSLGERGSGTTRLEEAVAAYRDALQERTRERVPLQWAMTQNNLGNALTSLGERGSGTTRLEEAIAAWDSRLTVAVSAWPPEWVQPVRSRQEKVRAEIKRRSAG